MVWGAFHGILLSLERIRRGRIRDVTAWKNPLRALLTFVLVCIGWVRCSAIRTGSSLLLHRRYIMMAVSLIMALLEERWQAIDPIIEGPRWFQAAAFASLALTIELFGVIDQTIPFVYFQF